MCDASFWDVGTVADYWATSRAFIDAAEDEDCWRGQRVQIDPTARVARSILWDDIEIGPDAIVDECVVTDGVHVPAGAAYRQMVLWQDTAAQMQAIPLTLSHRP